MYFGTRAAGQICIYDKKHERYAKNHEVFTNHWVRIEIRLKGTNATDFINRLSARSYDELAELFKMVLSQMLEFKGYSKKAKKYWTTWRPWERFIGDVQKLKLENQGQIEATITRRRDWHTESAGIAFIEIMSTMTREEQLAYFQELWEQKSSKIDNVALKRINVERENKGLPAFKNLVEYFSYIQTTGLVKLT